MREGERRAIRANIHCVCVCTSVITLHVMFGIYSVNTSIYLHFTRFVCAYISNMCLAITPPFFSSSWKATIRTNGVDEFKIPTANDLDCSVFFCSLIFFPCILSPQCKLITRDRDVIHSVKMVNRTKTTENNNDSKFS